MISRIIILIISMNGVMSYDEQCVTDEDCRRSGDIEAYCKSNGVCRCDIPYYGDLCDRKQCLDPTCGNHGTCNTTTGECECDLHYGGVNCTTTVCPGINHNCSGHGKCNESGYCSCFPPYVGPACDELSCPKNCSYPNGICNHDDGQCKCAHGWTSSSCDTPAPTPEHCTICLSVSKSSYCKCNLEEPMCQGTSDVRCDACCSDPRPSPSLKTQCVPGKSPSYPPDDLVFRGRCDASNLMSPMIYDEDRWPDYDKAFRTDGVSTNASLVHIGVLPDPDAAADVFAENDGWYDYWINISNQYRDCSRDCDADVWIYNEENQVCETTFNVPTYALVDDQNRSITMPDWVYGPVTTNKTVLIDFQNGMNGEIGMVTSMNSQGIAIPDTSTGNWHDNVMVLWDNELNKYVARLDTYVRKQYDNNTNTSQWIVDSTGGLVTAKQFMSGSFEVTAKVPQRSGLVFAMWLFNGAKTWSAHVPYPDNKCAAPSSGCSFFNSSQCVSTDKSRCPFDSTLNRTACEKSPGGAYIDKDTSPFTCLDNDGFSYQKLSGDPMWIDRTSYPGRMLPQICKEFPNSEIDWEIPSNAPETTLAGKFADHDCTPSTPCQFVHKYNTSNANNYRFTDGNGEGTYTNLWLEKKVGDFIDGRYHKYRMEVHSGTSGGCTPRVDYFFDDEYIGTNNAFVPRIAGRFWTVSMDRSTWGSGSGGWNGLLNETYIDSLDHNDSLLIYSSIHVSEIRINPYFEEQDTYAPQPYDQPSMGKDRLSNCGKKNPPYLLNSSFVPYFTDGDHPVGNVKWIRN